MSSHVYPGNIFGRVCGLFDLILCAVVLAEAAQENLIWDSRANAE